MKTYLPIIILFFHTIIFSQNKLTIYNKTENETLNKGFVSKLSITLYLKKKEKIDYCDLYNTFVEGWYYYDKYKIKISLIGFLDGCELSL